MVDFSKLLTRPPIPVPGSDPGEPTETTDRDVQAGGPVRELSVVVDDFGLSPSTDVVAGGSPEGADSLPGVPVGTEESGEISSEATIEDRLRATIGTLATEVTFPRGTDPTDPWFSAAADDNLFGWTAHHVEVGREDGWLYVDTDEGMRYYVPEDREVTIRPLQSLDEIFDMDGGQVAATTLEVPPATSVPGVDEDYNPDDLTADEFIDYERRRHGPEGEPQFMYLAGTAGTGKSYQARQRAAEYDDAILCATTGIAAVNLEGTTINSILRYYDTASLRQEYEFGRLNVALKQLAGSNYKRIIVDEISMMDGNQLDVLCIALDEVNEQLIAKEEKPIGMTLVGDFAQLPPVKAPFVFEKVKSWERFEANTVMLTEPRRQADPEFIRALQGVRRGDREAAPYFKRFISSGDSNFDGTTITATNAEVDRINKLRMIDLTTPEHKYISIRTGEEKLWPSEWKHVPAELTLKPGCLVMVLANYKEPGTTDIIYANGDLGHYIGPVLENNPKSDVMVKLKRTGADVRVHRVIRERKVATGNKGDKEPREEKVATIEYLPLRVAYGSTVHKSQGLSLDYVQLMINSKFWMEPGMLYVALSRARTPQGLKIVGSYDQFVARIRSNPLIARWL